MKESSNQITFYRNFEQMKIKLQRKHFLQKPFYSLRLIPVVSKNTKNTVPKELLLY